MRTAIFGAGQAGRMVRKWMPADRRVICYIDNSEDLQGQEIDGIPVLDLCAALRREPEEIFIAVLNRDAAAAIRGQLAGADYSGPVADLTVFRDHQDVRLAQLRLLAGEINRRGISGAVAELSVYRGEFAAEINLVFAGRRQYYFDTFCGFDSRDLDRERAVTGADRFQDFSDTCAEAVRARLPFPADAVLVQGYFPESLAQIGEETYAFVSLDPDLYAPTLAGLSYFWPRLSAGGAIMIHDYSGTQFPGVRRAVEEYCTPRGLAVLPIMDLHGTAILMRQGEL